MSKPGTGRKWAEGLAAGLRSRRLALALLLITALVASGGTFLEASRARIFFRHPLFLALLVLLSFNIVLCTWRRFALMRRRLPSASNARRLRLRVWTDLLLHLSILVILFGGSLKALLGYVGTQYLFPGFDTVSVYDPIAEEETPLGFTLVLRERVEDYFPLRILVGLKDPETGTRLDRVEVVEGRRKRVPGRDFYLEIADFDLEEKHITLRAERGDKSERLRLEIVADGRRSAPFAGLELVLIAWRRDLMRIRGRVEVVEGGRTVKEAWLAPNGRIAHRGWSVFLTSWGQDAEGNSYLGTQMSRDPGAPVFWSGAVLLVISLPLFLWVRHGGSGKMGRRDA